MLDWDSATEYDVAVEEFLDRVAERERHDGWARARRHVQVVLATIQADVTNPELERSRCQLPGSFDTPFSHAI